MKTIRLKKNRRNEYKNIFNVEILVYNLPYPETTT